MKLLKAEMWDKAQYLFRRYYDKTIHATFYFDGTVDTTLFEKSVDILVSKVPVLHSRFVACPITPFWIVKQYELGEILEVSESKNIEEDANNFACQSVSEKSNVQIKIGLIKGETEFAVVVLVNHMCADGGDTKYLIKKLFEIYNALQDGTPATFDIKNGNRSYTEIYSHMSDEDKKIAGGLYKNVSVVKDKHKFPWAKKSKQDSIKIVRRVVDENTFSKLKEKGKERSATVNDMYLTAYFRALYEIGNYNKEDTVAIPCMIDLRRHLKDGGETTGITNHTGFMVSKLDGVGETSLETLERVKKSLEEAKRDRFLGLYSLPLLSLAYKVFPQVIAEIAISIGYVNPLIGMSNIGILKKEDYSLNGATLKDAFMTGAVKYKPFMQLSTTTFEQKPSFVIAIKGGKADVEIIEKFFDIFETELLELTKI